MSELEVRIARSDAEITAAGALTAEAYHADRLIDDGDEYLAELLDARRRADEATLVVAMMTAGPGHDPVVVGTVTLAPFATSYAEIAEPGEVEVRMLAVAPEARRNGVAEALMRACLRESVVLGAHRVVLSTLDAMVTAHRLYERLGFVRVPERDWHHEEIALRVLAWSVPDAPGAAVEAATWRPLVVHDVDGWRAGESGGFTRRANSVVAVHPPADAEVAIEAVEQIYGARGLTPVYRIGRETRPVDLGDRLAARGYRRVSGAVVMVDDDLDALAGEEPIGLGTTQEIVVETADLPDERWMAVWLAGRSDRAAHADVGAAILRGSPALYLTALDGRVPVGTAERPAVGVIRAALVDDWVALACLVVPTAARRRGIGRSLTRAAVREASLRGARRAFLQVEPSNACAIGLYESLGFAPADSYAYVEPAR